MFLTAHGCVVTDPDVSVFFEERLAKESCGLAVTSVGTHRVQRKTAAQHFALSACL